MSASLKRRLPLLLMAAVAVGPSRTRAMTLQEALAAAYSSNMKLLAARAQLRVTDEGVAQAQANWRPTISVQASDSFIDDRITGASDVAAQAYLRSQYPGDSYGLTISQPIYRGGRTIAQIRQAKATVKSGEAELMSTEQQTLLSVATDYIDLTRDRSIIEITAKRESDAAADLKGANVRLTNGQATRLDVAKASAALRDALIAHQQAENQALSDKTMFVRDTGVEPNNLAPAQVPPDLPTSVEACQRIASDDNFDVQQADGSLHAAKAALSMTRGQALPTITLQGTLLHQDGVTYPGEAEHLEAASVQLRIPIYSGGLLASQIRASQATLDQQRDLLEAARRNAEAQAEIAFRQREFAATAESELRLKTQSLYVALQGTTRQAELGERPLSDIIAAKEALFVVQIAAAQAHHDAVLAGYTLAGTLGHLTARRLALDVRFYDADVYLRHISLAPGR